MANCRQVDKKEMWQELWNFWPNIKLHQIQSIIGEQLNCGYTERGSDDDQAQHRPYIYNSLTSTKN